MTVRLRVGIASRADGERARREARGLARSLGLDAEGTECVALAVSELASNLARHAQGGEIVLSSVEGPRGVGVRVESLDHGPGITNLRRAMEDGFSTAGSLGSGLPAVQRLMHEFEIRSGPSGTSVVASRWPSDP